MTVIVCKKCNSDKVSKNGIVRLEQRYKCKSCNHNFIIGDKRLIKDPKLETKQALSIILYSLGKSSFGFLGKLFNVNRSTAYRWIRNVAETIEEPQIPSSIKEMEFDEMWHFIGSKKTKNGSSKRWIVAEGKLLPGLQAIVMLKPSKGFIKKSAI